MPHVLIAGRIHRSGIDLIEAAADVTYDYVEATGADAFVPLIGAADALVVRTQPLTADTIARAPRLRMVARHGVGYDSVDVDALTARGVPLAVVGDVNSRSVAEHALAMLLAAAKELLPLDRAVRAGDWDRRDAYRGREVLGRRLLVLGYGRSGRTLARLAAAIGLEVEAYDPFVAPEAAEPPCRLVGDLGAALAAADFVSVHAPKGALPLVGPAEVVRIKEGAVVVNTARGGVLDEAALAAALRSGRVAAAGLDVFGDEPPSPDAALLAAETTILTPHVAGLAQEAKERMAVAAVRNALDFFAGRLDPELVVNRAALAERAAT